MSSKVVPLIDKDQEGLIRDLIQYVIGDDPDRPGLKDTPSRVRRSYAELFRGYNTDIKGLFKVFDEKHSDEMILCRKIEFWSTCEHHLLPFFGHASVAYIPNQGKVVGLSKLARVVDAYARRLQIQERMTSQITEALKEHLKPRGAACVIEATHLCMVCRGVQKQQSQFVTSSLTGEFHEPEVRAELFSLIRG